MTSQSCNFRASSANLDMQPIRCFCQPPLFRKFGRAVYKCMGMALLQVERYRLRYPLCNRPSSAPDPAGGAYDAHPDSYSRLPPRAFGAQQLDPPLDKKFDKLNTAKP